MESSGAIEAFLPDLIQAKGAAANAQMPKRSAAE